MSRLRRIAGALAAAAALTVLAAPVAAQGADAELVLEGVDSSSFPLVRAVVSGPAVDGELDDAFVVREDGEERNADVIRLRSNNLNVVIAVDVSTSMKDEALVQAKAAVGEMLATLPEGVPVSLVTFGDTAVVQNQFTADRGATLAAVDGLIAAGATALYDGVNLGLQQLATQGGTGALVVIADGDDSSSAASFDDTTAALAASGVDVSFVALETDSFRPDAIESMAAAAGGQAVTIDDSSQFVEALRGVAQGIGNVYEVRWRSASDDDVADLEIALAADTSRAVSTSYRHDPVSDFVPDVALDTRTVSSPGLLGSSWVPLVAALCVTMGAAVLFLVTRGGEKQAVGPLELLDGEELASLSPRQARRRDAKRNALTDVSDRLNDLSAQVLEVNDRGRNLDDTLDRAGLAIRANEFVVFCALVTLASLLFGVVLFGIPFFLLAAVFPAIGIPMTLKVLISRRRKKFVSQLVDTLQLMVGSLTAGYGLGQTLDSLARETESPTCEEFARVVMETRLGRSLEDALDAMSLRIQAPDFDWVVDAIKIQSSVGGNLSEIIDQVGDTIRARIRVKRQVDALTAEGKISALVLFVLPFGLCGFIGMTNPDYLKPLFGGETIGYVLVGVALTMLTIGGLWLKKLVTPEF